MNKQDQELHLKGLIGQLKEEVENATVTPEIKEEVAKIEVVANHAAVRYQEDSTSEQQQQVVEEVKEVEKKQVVAKQ